jgi:predicted DNA-binding WGR domain protein
MSKRYFEYTGADAGRGTSASAKFWEVDIDGSTIVVRFGKIGAAGQTTRKDLPHPAAAQLEADKLIAQKVKKGYTETALG